MIKFSLKFLIGLIVRKCTLNRLFSVVEYFLGAVKESQISKKLVGIPAIEGSFDSSNIFVNSIKIAKNYVLGLQEKIKRIKRCIKGKRMVKIERD